MIATKLTLKETLEHLKELADSGMYKTKAFDDAHNEYVSMLLECSDRAEIHDALNYLTSIDSIGMLNIENMKEQLECE
ncbi:MAG: hypothetical protein KBB91_00085 [Candidatus Pacebacteria bacterium]|jgi:hypothetical protein|nr:hypothetical protein [Candidatus Paceibacterota bacterium]MBP9700791.1 hypothetical protein [Candidatus Paceibacterota bacterium]